MFDMARSDPAASDLLDDPQLAPLLAGVDDSASLFTNRVAQPAIVAATLAMWAALRETVPAPALVAGYSIGELAAYGVSGALAPVDAVRLAVERAQLMDACLDPDTAQGMVAVSGIPNAATGTLLQRFGFYPAILTGEDTLVAGGPAAQREALAEAAAAAGARATALPVEVASHTPLLQGAVVPFEAVLGRQDWRAPAFPVLAGISAEKVEDARLATQVL